MEDLTPLQRFNQLTEYPRDTVVYFRRNHADIVNDFISRTVSEGNACDFHKCLAFIGENSRHIEVFGNLYAPSDEFTVCVTECILDLIEGKTDNAHKFLQLIPEEHALYEQFIYHYTEAFPCMIHLMQEEIRKGVGEQLRSSLRLTNLETCPECGGEKIFKKYWVQHDRRGFLRSYKYAYTLGYANCSICHVQIIPNNRHIKSARS
jgi:hypothetical protein